MAELVAANERLRSMDKLRKEFYRNVSHELATPLGTVIQWRRNGVSYVLAGSLPPAAAETAARDLK